MSTAPPTTLLFCRRRAFTLLEVLVAVAAFAVVLAAINGVYYGALRLRNKTVASFEQSAPLEQTLTILRRDLANLVVPGSLLAGPLQTTLSSAANNSTDTNAAQLAASLLQPGQVSPNFYTATGFIDENSPFSDLQKVAYLLQTATNGSTGRDLFRSVTRNLLATVQEQPVLQPLLQGVDALAFLYFDGTEWRTTWDSTVADQKTGQTNTLPKAIKVQLTLLSDTNSTRLVRAPLELIVPIEVQQRTNAVAQSTGGQP